MQAVILAGGLGTRIQEESHTRPKPMIEIGGMPILWHIMKTYSQHGVNDFVICLGYKGYMIKEYFLNFLQHSADFTVNTASGDIKYHNNNSENWQVTLIDTGELSMTGGRLKRVAKYLDDDFCMTYGDGVADVDITELIEFHKSHNKEATMTSVAPPGRYGAIETNEDSQVQRFLEKPSGSEGRINGGYFVLNKKAIERISGDDMPFESEPLETLAADGELKAFQHNGFWQAMDTLRDRNNLEELWATGNAPWKIWT
jgi:glucose-1-phosphate cytidylyltransferase